MSGNTTTNSSSTLKAYVDSATGAVQNLVGNVVGSPGEQAQGKARQQKAQAEHDASHADTAKLPGGVTASSSSSSSSSSAAGTGAAVTRDDPRRGAGSWDQTAGSAKEFVGGLVGDESLKQSGREQNRSGQQQEARGQLSDYASGLGDRVSGAVGTAAAGLAGDRPRQAEFQDRHDEGKTRQRGAEHDIRKQTEARQ